MSEWNNGKMINAPPLKGEEEWKRFISLLYTLAT